MVAGGEAHVGIAVEGYDVERDGETSKSTAVVVLHSGTTAIHHPRQLKDYIPKTLP